MSNQTAHSTPDTLDIAHVDHEVLLDSSVGQHLEQKKVLTAALRETGVASLHNAGMNSQEVLTALSNIMNSLAPQQLDGCTDNDEGTICGPYGSGNLNVRSNLFFHLNNGFQGNLLLSCLSCINAAIVGLPLPLV